MILVTAFQYDGSDLNRKACNCAYKTKQTLPPPPTGKKIPLSEDQLVVSFLTGSYLVRLCSIHFFFLLLSPPWMGSLHQHLISYPLRKWQLKAFLWSNCVPTTQQKITLMTSPWLLFSPGKSTARADCLPNTLSATNQQRWEPLSFLMGNSKQLCWTPVSAPVPGDTPGKRSFGIQRWGSLVTGTSAQKLFTSHMIVLTFVKSL